MTEKINKYLASELVLVSDVHLRRPEDPRSQLMSQLLAALAAAKPRNFVLLGDIFDFCLGSRSYFRRKFAGFGRQLSAVAQGGTRVVFFEGNHEFNLPAVGWASVDFIPEGDHLLTFGDGSRVKLAHGDLVYAPTAYLWFRGFVKSRFARLVSWLVPMKWLDTYALGHSKVSRSQDKYRVLDHTSLLKAVNTWADADQAKHAIFGHFHIPYAEQRAGGGGLILSVDSWDKPNALIYTQERGFERIFWGAGGIDDFTVQPVKSFLKS